jgi:hypothetical protein
VTKNAKNELLVLFLARYEFSELVLFGNFTVCIIIEAQLQLTDLEYP